jgi:hypothetical protein
MKITKLVVVSAASALVTLTAGAASATNVGILDTVTGYVNGEHVYVSPLVIDGKTYFCITPDRDQAVGTTTQNFVPVAFTPATSVQVAGMSETAAQIGSVAYLIDESANATGNLAAEYAAAIWDTEGQHTTFDDPSLSAAASSLSAGAIGKSGHADYIADTNFVGQSGGAVPEPASWALMLVGFGAAGATLRCSRRQLALG